MLTFKGIYAYKAAQHARKYHIEGDELNLVAKPFDYQPVKGIEPYKVNKPRYPALSR